VSYRTLLLSILIPILGGVPGCTRTHKPAVERLAVLPFDNLSSDAGLNWLGPAAATVIAYDLAGAPELFTQAVDSIQGAYSMQATRILQGYFFERNGRLEIRASLEDAGKRTVAGLTFAGVASEGLLPLANEMAKRLSPAARVFSTKNPPAFREYGGARSAGDITLVLRGLQAATTADPHFQAAYIDWAKIAASSGDRDHALTIIDQAKANDPDGIDRARLDNLAATLKGTAAEKIASLETLAKLTPADGRAWKELAELQVAQRRFPEALQSFQTAGRLLEEDPNLWNEMGYAYAFAQDRAGAVSALEHYRQLLDANETNGLDSLGEVSFYLGDFSAAEKYFLEAQRKNPKQAVGALLKAAQARLMTGDLAGADTLFQRGAPNKFQQAQWEFLTGRRKVAMQRLQKLAAELGGSQKWLVLNQLSIWKIQTGDPQAAALAEEAEAAAPGIREKNLSAMTRVLAARGAVRTGAASIDAYALLFGQKFAEAVPLLEKLYGESNPSFDGEIRTLLAWAYERTERSNEAAKLTELYPIPMASNEGFFASLIFPRFLGVRAIARRQPLDLYKKFAGDIPDA
jgi:Flp pilus assembly protein TadD